MLTNVTICGNSASASHGAQVDGVGGGVYVAEEGRLSMRNSVLWGNVWTNNNTPNQIDVYPGDPDTEAVLTDCVVEGGFEGGTNIITADPKLGALGNYGGYTPTIPLLEGSSAIDAGADYDVDTDQRGVSRPQGAGYDIGAYEAEVTPPTLSFTSAGQNVLESVGKVLVTAQLSAATTQDVTFTFRVGGTASRPDDYTVALSWWRVTIPAGSLTGDIPIDIVDDSAGGPDETVVVTLDEVTNATKGDVTEHTVTIVNDDPVSDPTTSLISGRVTDGDSDRGVSSVLITATPVGYGLKETAVTDDGGYYCFTALLPGTYEITASKTWSSFAPGPASGELWPVRTVPPPAHDVNFRRIGQVMGPATIVVESPNGGEEWEVGSTETLVWFSFDLYSNVKIELSRDGGNTYSVLFESTVDDGQETWTVTGPATSQARLRISGVDPDVAGVSDVSDGDFTINAVNEPPVAVDDEYTTDEDTILIVLADGTPPRHPGQ